MLVRLWLFTARQGNYPEGGTYDTSVLDSESGNCSDPQQFDRFQSMLAYGNARGEQLQQVNSAEQAYSMCSRIRATVAPTSTLPMPPNFQGGTMEHAIYQPTEAGGGICGCKCTGGGQKTEPVPQYYDPNQSIAQYTPSGNAQRVISLARGKRFGTIVY